MFHGWRVVAGAFAMLFMAFGCAYTFTAFFQSLQSEFNASRGSISLIFSISSFLYFALGSLSGALADRVETRWITATGMFLVAVGLLLASRATELWHLYAAYGLGVGVGIGLAYAPALGAVQRWFVRQRGSATGWAVAGIGLGTTAVPPVAAWMIAELGWRQAYFVLGLSVLVAGVGAALFVEGSPAKRNLLPDGDDAPAIDAENGAAPSRPELLLSVSLRQALRTKLFWIFYGTGILATIGIALPFVHLIPFVEDQGLPRSTALYLLGCIGIGSTLGRFILGAAADKFGRRPTFVGIYAGLTVAYALWLVGATEWPLIGFALLFGICYGGYVALAPAIMADYFGVGSVGAIIGGQFTAAAIAMFLAPYLAGIAFDQTNSYFLPIAASCAGAAISGVVTARLENPDVWLRNHHG